MKSIKKWWHKKILLEPFCFDCNEPMLDMKDFYDVDLILTEDRGKGAMCSRCGITWGHYF